MKNKGALYGAGAYFLWGIFPLYVKALHAVPALQIVSHRVTWSFAILLGLVLAGRNWKGFVKSASDRKTLVIYALSAVLLSLNWLVYVWSVNAGHVVEASLGYFINPLLSVMLGVLLLRERLRPLQWLPVALAALGVAYLTIAMGVPPWIALALASTFALYGLVKKIAPLGSLYGLTLETGLLFLPALGYLLFVEGQGSGAFGHIGWGGTLLLAMAGVVTSIPLLLFASAARLIPLSMMGLLQFITPTCQFLIGLLVFHEPFSSAQLAGFSIIWLALAIFTIEGFWQRNAGSDLRRQHRFRRHYEERQTGSCSNGAKTSGDVSHPGPTGSD
jgi:chloramphenicol-sensitive protein RarD